jgi:alpha-L-rhamnosidase
VLGLDDLVERYAAIAAGAKTARRADYLRPSGRLTEERQAHYVRALAFDLVPDQLPQPVADRLAELKEAGDRLGTAGASFLHTHVAGLRLPELPTTHAAGINR